MDTAQEALERYEAAEDRRLQAQKEWEDAGRPMVVELENRVRTMAPELKVLMECEKQSAAMLRDLAPKRAGAGRPPGSASAPDRQGSPAKVTPLRKVG